MHSILPCFMKSKIANSYAALVDVRSLIFTFIFKKFEAVSLGDIQLSNTQGRPTEINELKWGYFEFDYN